MNVFPPISIERKFVTDTKLSIRTKFSTKSELLLQLFLKNFDYWFHCCSFHSLIVLPPFSFFRVRREGLHEDHVLAGPQKVQDGQAGQGHHRPAVAARVRRGRRLVGHQGVAQRQADPRQGLQGHVRAVRQGLRAARRDDAQDHLRAVWGALGSCRLRLGPGFPAGFLCQQHCHDQRFVKIENTNRCYNFFLEQN